jgi:UDP-N-acetylglucosamine transferase subunit ALG13
MKTPDTDNLAEALVLSAAQLREIIDSHNKLLAEALGIEGIGNTTSNSDEQLRQALYETVDALEETRKVFKSKKFETLRKKLIKILMET